MKRLFHILRYIRHYVVANSRHGTHSPFVYALADQVVYRRSPVRQSNGGVDQLLQAIAEYFEVEYTDSQADVGWQRALLTDPTRFTVDELSMLQHQFKYIVLRNVHTKPEGRRYWTMICTDARFVVAVDLFFVGLIFYREEQPKQTFKLRYPLWRLQRLGVPSR